MSSSAWARRQPAWALPPNRTTTRRSGARFSPGLGRVEPRDEIAALGAEAADEVGQRRDVRRVRELSLPLELARVCSDGKHSASPSFGVCTT